MIADPLEGAWLVLENTQLPGEHITLQSGPEKYALVFTDARLAALFLADLDDRHLGVSNLQNWVLKESFLSAAALVGATRVLFDYRRGTQAARSAGLEALHALVRARLSGEGSRGAEG